MMKLLEKIHRASHAFPHENCVEALTLQRKKAENMMYELEIAFIKDSSLYIRIMLKSIFKFIKYLMR